MRAGQLDCLVSIRAHDGTQGTDGQPSVDPADFVEIADGECWADIFHPNGKESMRAGKDTSVVEASIRVRYRTDVTASMRVVHESDTYEVKAVLPDKSSRKYTDLVCELLSGN
jgi:SPP1 family predicted phage head-tail adaptor